MTDTGNVPETIREFCNAWEAGHGSETVIAGGNADVPYLFLADLRAVLDEREQLAALIGPLTAAEWCSLRLTEGDDDPLYCCAASSEFRSALFHVLRMGADAELRYYLVEAWQQAVAYGHGQGGPLLDRIRDYYRLDDDPPAFAPEDMRCAPHCATPCHTALREVEQERDHWKQMYELSQPGRLDAHTTGGGAG